MSDALTGSLSKEAAADGGSDRARGGASMSKCNISTADDGWSSEFACGEDSDGGSSEFGGGAG